MADKKHKRAQEKQSESLPQPCAITVHGEGAQPFSKPQEYSFRAAAREKWVTFYGKTHKIQIANKIPHGQFIKSICSIPTSALGTKFHYIPVQ